MLKEIAMAMAPRSYPKGKACMANGGLADRRFKEISDAEIEATTGEKSTPPKPAPSKGFWDNAKEAVTGAVKSIIGGKEAGGEGKQAPREYPKKGYADGGPIMGYGNEVARPMGGMGQTAQAAQGGGLPAIGPAPQMKPLVGGGMGDMAQAAPATPAPWKYDPVNAPMQITNPNAGAAQAQMDMARAAPAGGISGTGYAAPAMPAAGGALGGTAVAAPGGGGRHAAMRELRQANRGMGMGAQRGSLRQPAFADGGMVKKAPKPSKGVGKPKAAFEKPTEKGNVIRAFADGGQVKKGLPKGFKPFTKGSKPFAPKGDTKGTFGGKGEGKFAGKSATNPFAGKKAAQFGKKGR